MASVYGKHFSTRSTPQTEPIPGKPMVPNSAGGYSFAVDKWSRLNRFLVLGAEGGSYYATEKDLVIENCEAARECLAEDPTRVVNLVLEISESGRAPKNDPAIFVLAMAVGLDGVPATVKEHALSVMPRVCRIGTHLFQFAEAVQKFRGWGRGLRKGLAAWYTSKDAEALAYQVAKYQQRNGWSHRDILRLAHPTTDDPAKDAVFRWVVGGMDAVRGREVKRGEAVKVYGSVADQLPALIQAMEEAKTADADRIVTLIRDHDLPRECIPTEHLNSLKVWEALLVKMPLHATVRNLGKMSSIGLLTPMSAAAKLVQDRLSDREYIRKSRLHPLAILIALRTYASGRGLKGSLTWTPVSQVNDALDAAFYMAFDNVVPANKRTLMGLDVSASMTGAYCAGSTLTCAEGAAAMAMVQAKTEPQYQLMAFDQGMRPLDIGRYSRLADVLRNTSNINGGGTDCSLPMTMALANGWAVDTFQVYTDNETWAGSMHASQALVEYRRHTGIPAKLIVIGMVASNFSIADPSDSGMLDVCGFDASTPSVLADFSRS